MKNFILGLTALASFGALVCCFMAWPMAAVAGLCTTILGLMISSTMKRK